MSLDNDSTTNVNIMHYLCHSIKKDVPLLFGIMMCFITSPIWNIIGRLFAFGTTCDHIETLNRHWTQNIVIKMDQRFWPFLFDTVLFGGTMLCLWHVLFYLVDLMNYSHLTGHCKGTDSGYWMVTYSISIRVFRNCKLSLHLFFLNVFRQEKSLGWVVDC